MNSAQREQPIPTGPTLPPNSFGEVTSRSPRLHQSGITILGSAAFLGAGHLFFSGNSDHAIIFTLLCVVALGCIWSWASRSIKGLPFLPLFLLQQGMIYAMPLVVGDENLSIISSGTLYLSAFSVVLLLLSALAGHRMGSRSAGPPPLTRWPFFRDRNITSSPRTANLCLALLGSSIAFYLTTRSGLLYQLLPGSLWSLFPVIRTGSDAASMFGALIGGIALVDHPQRIKAVIYWVLLASIFFLSIADVLLSAATGLIIATSIGMALGRAKFPWFFLISAFAILAFLNQGKFTVRDKYWDSETNTTRLAISQLPTFYLDWASVSAEQLLWKEDDLFEPTTAKPSKEEEGQNLLDRIDNLQILTFVVNSIESEGKPTLLGKTYALIPPLLVPRFLWHDKPRSHEGQVLLNLHFERQKTREETEKTYIAWGLLPEAVGNFGVFFGPIFLGLLGGFVCGKLEYFSIRKELFSIEGLILLALLLKVTTSFEMVSSVFVTSTFQFLVVVAIGSWFVCLWFRSGAPPVSLRRTAPQISRP